MEKFKSTPIALTTALSLLLLPCIAQGQDNPPAPPPEPAVAPAPVPVAPVIVPVPVKEPMVAKAAEPESTQLPTDHETIVRHWGIGFIGIANVPLADAAPIGTSEQPGVVPNDRVTITRVATPTLGARRWLTKKMAIDLGVGMNFTAGATSADYGDVSASVDKPTIFSMSLHTGIPITVADTRHMTFFVVPQATFGFAASNVAPQFDKYSPPDAKLRGAKLDLGVRAGAEVYFGFMGLPRLALEAGIGLFMTAEWASATVANQSVSDTSISLSTSAFSDPWDIFSSFSGANVAARYYF